MVMRGSRGGPAQRRAVAIAIAAAMVFTAGACGGSDSNSKGDGGTQASRGESSQPMLRVGSPSGLDSPSPITQQASDAVMTAIYPKLVQYDAELKEIVPDLATSWTASADGKTVTFEIASGGAWSDGKPVTARDAAFTINTFIEYGPVGGAGVYAVSVNGLVSAEATDDATLVVTTKKPVPEGLLLANLMPMPILPEHVWSQHTGDGGRDLLKFSNNPAVTGGPFHLKSFKKNEAAVMVRNDSYYGSRPHIEQLVIKRFSSPDAMVSALSSGELDLAMHLPAPSLPAVEKNADVTTTQGPLFREQLIYFNVKPDTQSPALKDQQVRRAIDLAIDRENLVQVAYGETGAAARGMLPPELGPWHDPSTDPTFDAAQAQQILEEAGYTAGEGGIREKDGQPLSFRMLLDVGDPNALRMFQLLQSDLKEVGIELEAGSQDIEAAISTVTKTNRWDMLMIGGGWTVDPDAQITNNMCGGGFGTYCDKAYDAMARRQQTTLDEEERVELVQKIERHLADDGSVMVLAMRRDITGYRKGWEGIVPMPDGALSYLGSLTPVNAYKG